MSVRIVFKDFKGLEELKKSGKVRVGWREDTKYDENTPVYKIAAIQEYGATIPVTDKMRGWFLANGFPLKKTTTEIIIPPRPFIRQTKDANLSKWTEQFQNNLEKVVKGEMTFEQMLMRLGATIQGDIKETISNFKEPKNSPMTIAMKGKDTPLRNTGIMQETVDFEVEINAS